ncbi:MAG: cytidine deaminase [Micrococcales bacterium]|nr:cytidine deaminase [Micrococcales bacterium]
MVQAARTPSDEELLQLARDVAANAYVPYSRFPVGAALLTRGGEVVTGCNVENASFGLTICAERTATTRMCAQADPQAPDGGTRRRIVTAAVVALKAAPCFPCGACRQVLHEFGCQFVVVEDADGSAKRYPFAQILPHSFGPEDLDVR